MSAHDARWELPLGICAEAAQRLTSMHTTIGNALEFIVLIY
jgi:hypothetical protein